MSRKRILLFLALVLPLLVFLFLKFFGKNEFAIPVFYQDKIDSVNTVCGTRYTLPYHIPDSVLHEIGWLASPATLYKIQNISDSNVIASDKKELERVFEDLPGSVQFASDWQVLLVDSSTTIREKLHRWHTCVFMVPPGKDLVLIDKDKQIRGYYAIESRDEVDRLLLELEILLKKY